MELDQVMPERMLIDNEARLPVQTFFNAIEDNYFVQVMDSLTNGEGCLIGESECSFPNDLGPEEESYDGVRFSMPERWVVISGKEISEYIKLVCNDFSEQFPDKRDAIQTILARIPE
jgi:hypothetical protein